MNIDKMKKPNLLFCLFLLAFSGNVFAQSAEENLLPESDLYSNSVFIEFAGNAALVSLNYERLFPLADPGKTLVLRAGTFLAPYSIKQNDISYELFLPLEASVLMGKRAVRFEFGYGATLYRYFNSSVNANGERIYYGRNDFLLVMRVGGRWQVPGKHWFVKVAATPFLKENFTGIDFLISPWAGISVGYNFGRR